jgi:hypothetical protein
MAWKYQLIIKNPQSHPSRNRQPGLGKSGLSGRHAKAVGWLCNKMIKCHSRPTVRAWRAPGLEPARIGEGFGGMAIAAFSEVVVF